MFQAESAISSGKEECAAIKVDVNPGVLLVRLTVPYPTVAQFTPRI